MLPASSGLQANLLGFRLQLILSACWTLPLPRLWPGTKRHSTLRSQAPPGEFECVFPREDKSSLHVYKLSFDGLLAKSGCELAVSRGHVTLTQWSQAHVSMAS